MLHANHSNFSNSEDSLLLPATAHSFAAGSEVITVSAVQSAPLHESVLAADQPPYSAADMAVMALALVGAWMVVLGLALLVRYLRLARQPELLAQQHQ